MATVASFSFTQCKAALHELKFYVSLRKKRAANTVRTKKMPGRKIKTIPGEKTASIVLLTATMI